MREIEPLFHIKYESTPVTVVEQTLQGVCVFHVTFPDERKPLAITVADAPGGKRWWTSIPEGRQREAESIGKLIAAYIRGKNK